MARKLIELHNEYLVVCDNCDFKVENETKDGFADISAYLNVACPKCGANLLTEKDYADSVAFLKAVKFVNRYFGWLAWLPFRKRKTIAQVKIHDGMLITK